MEEPGINKQSLDEEVKKLYFELRSIDKVAEKLSLNTRKIRKIIFGSEKVSDILYSYFIGKTRLRKRNVKSKVEKNDKVLLLYKQGMPLREIEAVAGIERYSAASILHLYGIYVREKNPEKENEIVKIYTSGKITNYNELGRIYGRSGVGITNILKRHGVYKLQISKEQKENIGKRNKEIIEKFDNGIPISDIVSEFKISDRSVRRILSENNRIKVKPYRIINNSWKKISQKEKDELTEIIIDLFRKRNSINKISIRLKYPAKIIRTILIQNGVYTITPSRVVIGKIKIARDNTIIEKYDLGTSIEEIVSEFNLSELTVKHILFEHSKLIDDIAWLDLSSEERGYFKEKIIDLFRAGNSIGSISKQLQYSTKAIRCVLVGDNIYRISPSEITLNTDKIDRDKKIIEQYDKGDSIKILADKFNIREDAVKQVVIRSCWMISENRWNNLTQNEKDVLKEKIIGLYKSGDLIVKISNSVKYPTQVIRHVLIHNKMYTPILTKVVPKIPKKERDRKIIEWYRKGKKLRPISKRFGLTEYQIWEILKKAGVSHNRVRF